MKPFFPLLFCILTLSSTAALAAETEPGVTGLREPRFPLKEKSRIYPEDRVRQARENIEKYPATKAIADKTIKQASPWLERSDEELLRLITTSAVPRAFNVGTAGCPKCGKEIYEKGGTYPWILHLENQFKVECPICGGVYPDNDFEAFYRSGLKDKSFLEGKYSDDGWGWVGPDGHRYWFVAYANHWNWRNNILPPIQSLARAYLLTQDPRFAHKAGVMLYRVAQVYPGMDYHTQSRYGQLQAAAGSRYEGKTVNCIWETGVLTMLAESYDLVWDTIDRDSSLQNLLGKSGEEIRAFIEANLLEEGIDCIYSKKISGNYGMHQKALIYAALARDQGPVDEWIEGLFTRIDPHVLHLGLNYALYDLVYRDGVPFETSPGYNFSWIRNITDIAENLKKAGRDAYAIPKTKRIYDGVLDIVNTGSFTPSLGDSGSVYGGLVGQDGFTFQSAFRAYSDPRYGRFLASFGAVGEKGITEFESLFHKTVEFDSDPMPPLPARLLDGYGMGILNNPKDTVSASLYYGYKGGHGHFDRMHFELFANGQPMMPDLGYPDFMNAYVPGIYTWSKNTICHNSVTVDASRQKENQAGTVNLFVDSPFARVIDVDAPETYPQCSSYRRHLVMVDVDEERSYFVDFFTVEGGSQHDYSLHGPPGEFEAIGGSWTEPAAGTLAGETVKIGEIYDDPTLADPGYTGGFYGYNGSGFQHLFDVQRHREGNWVAEWKHEKNPSARLRVRVLEQGGQEIILANAQVSPVKHKQIIKYIIARRMGENVSSRFLSVIEPFSEKPFIEEVASMDIPNCRGVTIRREGGTTDRILYNPTNASVEIPGTSIKSDANTTVISTDDNGSILRSFCAGGTISGMENRPSEFCPRIVGEVVSVKPSHQEVRVQVASLPKGFNPSQLAGKIVHFENDIRRTAHPIRAAALEGMQMVLTTRDDLLVGRAHVTGIDSVTVETDAHFHFAPTYRGTFLCDLDFERYYPIREARTDKILLREPLPEDHCFAIGKDAWIMNVGPGDQMKIIETASN